MSMLPGCFYGWGLIEYNFPKYQIRFMKKVNYGSTPVYDVRVDRKKTEQFIKDNNRFKGSRFIRLSLSLKGIPYN